MKKTLSKNGYKWHHEITHFPDLMLNAHIVPSDKHTWLCSYLMHFLIKLLFVIPAAIIIIGSILGYYLKGWAVLLFADTPSFGFFIGENNVWVIINCIIIWLLIIVILLIVNNTLNDRQLNKPAKPDGFIKTYYKAKQRKYCHKMKY